MRALKFLNATLLTFFVASGFEPRADAQALKKVRMASSSTNVSFLALYTALHRGFFKDEGIDLEIIFIVPWTLVFQELGPRALVTMGLFVGMLFLGFVYVWKKGALEWE